MACERVCGVNDNIEKAHYHSYYEIYYMEAGERHFVINNQPYFARQGDFVLFSPYIMHCAYSGKDIAFKRILICFREHEISSEELREKLLQLNEEIIQQEEQAENIDKFIGKVRKYLDLDELTPTVLNDMVKAVYVHAPDKSKGYREQQIDISYDLVGILPAAMLNDL